MRAFDIVLQLSARLPALVSDFSESIAINQLTQMGNVVTAETSSPHPLKVGNAANIQGAITPVGISSLIRDGFVGSLETTTPHDINNLDLVSNAELNGSVESEFNGTFEILAIPNRNELTIKMPDSGPIVATGNSVLLNGSNFFQSYNGLVGIITVNDNTHFTYEIEESGLFSPAQGNITAEILPRISSAASLPRILDSYTKQEPDDAWIFVVMDDALANKSRLVNSDAVDHLQKPNFFDQKIIQNFSLYAFFPTTDEISGRKASDRAEELLQAICQSVCFAKFDSLLTSKKVFSTQFVGHGTEEYNTAFYIHRYSFQITFSLLFSDTIGFAPDVAFRDIILDMSFDNVGTGKMSSSIKLDE